MTTHQAAAPRIFLTAAWRHLAVLNYEVDPARLAEHVPPGTELDFDEQGKTYVFAPTKSEYRELAVNQLPGRTLATIAAADESLFLRTDTALYRIQTPR